jgi:hypothetical protein
MTHAARIRSAVVLLSVLLASATGASVIVGCGDNGAAGPLRSFSVKGQPIVTDAGIPVVPGQSVDATAYVVNTAADPVTLVSASLATVSGFPAGTLRHVAVDTSADVVGVEKNWPPTVPLRAFSGAKLANGESRIVFGISGQRVGDNYGDAGINIVYRYRGREYSVTAWSAVLACVTDTDGIKSPSVCGNVITDRLMRTVMKMAG